MIDKELLRVLDKNLAAPTDGEKRTDLRGDVSSNDEKTPEMDEVIVVVDDEDEITEIEEAIAVQGDEKTPEMDEGVIVVLDDEDETPGMDEGVIVVLDDEDETPEMDEEVIVILDDENEYTETEDPDEINVEIDLDEIKHEAFKSGYEEGFAEGKNEAELAAKEEIDNLYKNRYEEGFAEGCEKAETEAEESLEDAVEEAHDEGFEAGYARGRREGLDAGYSKGRNEGFRAGYLRGRADGIEIGRDQALKDDEESADQPAGAELPDPSPEDTSEIEVASFDVDELPTASEEQASGSFGPVALVVGVVALAALALRGA